MNIKNHVIIVLMGLFLNIGITYGKESTSKKNNTIKGNVTLPNGDPAIGAMVGVTNTNKFTITDASGTYTLSGLAFGKYNIEISTIEASVLYIDVNLNEKNHSLDVKLEKSNLLELDDVTVTAKSEGQKIKERGYSLNLVDTENAMLSSLQATDLLDRTAGIKLRQSGGMGSDVQFNINGLSGNSVRIFIDGIPIRNYGPSFSLSSIPPSMIERIELYKGVVPAHLAEDALGGAVNVIMKESVINNINASYSYGSFNTHRADAGGTYRHEKSGFTIGGSAFYNYTDNDYDVYGDQVYIIDSKNKKDLITAKRFNDKYKSLGVNAKLGFTRTKWADRFMLGLLYSDLEKGIQNGPTMEIVYGKRKSLQSTQLANLEYRKDDIVKGLDVSVLATYSYGVRQTVDTTSNVYNWLGNIVSQSAKGQGEAGNATLAKDMERNMAVRGGMGYDFLPNHRVSVNWLHDNLTRDVEDVLLTQVEQDFLDTRYLTKNIFSLAYDNTLIDEKLKISLFYKRYMQDIELSDPIKIDGVITSNLFKRNTEENGYGGAISYTLIPEITLMFSGEQAVRLPEHNELLGNLSQNIEASYNLRPESGLNFNIGATFGTFTLADYHNFSGEINVFYRDIKDMIQRSLTEPLEDLYGYENIGKVLSRGVDFDLRYNWKDMLFVNYSLSNFNARNRTEYNEGDNAPDIYNNRLRNAPYFTMNTSISFVKKDFLSRYAELLIEYNFGYVHKFFRNWEGLGSASSKATIPTQMVHDIGVVYKFPKNFSIGIDAKNIFNEQVFDNWALQKPGRAFYIKLSYYLH